MRSGPTPSARRARLGGEVDRHPGRHRPAADRRLRRHVPGLRRRAGQGMAVGAARRDRARFPRSSSTTATAGDADSPTSGSPGRRPGTRTCSWTRAARARCGARAVRLPIRTASGPSAPGFMTRGIDAPADYYYRRVFTDAVRAVDAVRSLGLVDPARVAVTGVSQGGGIATRGRRPRRRPRRGHAGCAVPLPLRAGDRHDRPRPVPGGRSISVGAPRSDQRVLATLSYFDGANFATRITAPDAVLGGPAGSDVPAVHRVRRLQPRRRADKQHRGLRLQRPRGRRRLSVARPGRLPAPAPRRRVRGAERGSSTMSGSGLLAIDAGQTGMKVRLQRGSERTDILFGGIGTHAAAAAAARRRRRVRRSRSRALRRTSSRPGSRASPIGMPMPRPCCRCWTAPASAPRCSRTTRRRRYLGALGDTRGAVVASGTGVVTLAVGRRRRRRASTAGATSWATPAAATGSAAPRSTPSMRDFDGRGPRTALTDVRAASGGPIRPRPTSTCRPTTSA